MATYTVEQAREKWEKAGKVWSPDVEASLRNRGIIEQPAPPPPGLPWLQELGAGLGSMIAGPTSGLGGQLDAAQRLATGTTVGEQTTAGALGGITAGQMSPERLGVPSPNSVVQRGANLFGQGAGMAAAFTPIVKGAGMATGAIANPLLRAAATGGLSFGAYNAAAPAENIGERLQNVGEGALTGAVLGPLPMLPGVSKVAALPGGRTAIDLAAFTGLGVAHGQDPATALVEALPQLAAMKLVHGAAEKPQNPRRPTPEQASAEIDALEARLANERAPMQDEISARVAPFREAQANAQRVQAETPAEAPAQAPEMPLEQSPQYAGTLSRIEAMRARQANPPPPAPEQPLARTPAQMEIPLETPPAKETRGQRRARQQAEAIPPAVDEIQDTRGRGVQYHGSPAPIDGARSDTYSADNIYGQGLYTTDSLITARGYSGRKGSVNGRVYEIAPNRETKIFDMDAEISKTDAARLGDTGYVNDYMAGAIEDVIADGKPVTLTRVLDALRDNSYSEGLTKHDVQEIMDGVRYEIEQLGYDGMTHEGGKFHGNKHNHKVVIYFDPQNAVSIKEIQVPPRPPRSEVTTDMLGGQQVFEAVGKALAKPVRETVADIKDVPRRMRNLKADVNTDWQAAREELVKNVDESPVSVPFSRANRGEQTYEQAVDQVVSMPRRVRKLTDLRAYPDKATPGVKDIIDTDNLSALRADISKPLADRLDRAPASDLPEKQRGLTDPVRKTQEISDGELASAVEMSEIHGGREIEMATYKQAAEFGSQYKDLKKRAGITGKAQLEIAGKLLENYTSRNRGHVGNDLQFVQDPANRQLLLDSGNPQGMFEYVKGVRELMDSAGNLYNKASKGMGGDGMGDIAAYFPKVGTKPKFFEVGERLARAKARKGADPRTRNTADQVFNPRSQRRSTTDPNKVEMDGREIPREWNAETVLEGYLDTMLRGVSGDIALSQSMKAAKYDDILADRAERAGNQQEADNRRARANVIRTLAQQKWNHQLFGVGARAEDVFKSFGAPGSMALEAVAANKRAFDNTKYRLNPRFNLVTQWTSVLNPTFADPVAAMLALRDMGVPGLPNEAKTFAESTYESKRKAMPHSQMRAQVEGTGSLGDALSAPTGVAQKAANVANKVFFDGLTQGIENWTNKYSALIGYHSTRNLKGLTPRQRALAAGQTVFKTQSAYTFGERAGVLNSRAVQGLAPAQGYAVELANQIREALGATGVDTKLYGETGSQQARRAGAIVAAAIMQNIWQNVIFSAMRGKSPEESLNFDTVWDATVALPPFISLLLPLGKSGRDMPNPVLPVAQVNTIANKGGKVVSKIAKGEDAAGAAVDAARYWAANWGGPGGAFASDLTGGRYDFLMGDDSGAAAPNTVRSRPVAPRSSRGRQAIPRR